ncbi:MAG: hypothetical protein LC633_08470 [Desulfobulbaceae bacterium]|nr:hypothetical protein [Desulfobulbaceae bacterium]
MSIEKPPHEIAWIGLQSAPTVFVDEADRGYLRPGGNAPQVIHFPSRQGAVNGKKLKILIFAHGICSLGFDGPKGRVVSQM